MSTPTGEDLVLRTEAVDRAIHAAEAETPQIVQFAHALTITNDEEANAATEFLSRVAGLKRHIETERRTIVDPINQGVKEVNDRMKGAQVPYGEADEIVRGKMRGYIAEQERIDREARQAEEARARAEREEADRQAAEAAAEAEKAEGQRTAAADEMEAGLTKLSTIDLVSIVRGGREDERQAAANVLERRRAHRRAEDAAEAAAETASEAADAERAAAHAPAAPRGPMRSESGAVSTRKRMVARVVDETQLPRRFVTPNMKAINEAVKNGETDIPGCVIEEVKDISVRAK